MPAKKSAKAIKKTVPASRFGKAIAEEMAKQAPKLTKTINKAAANAAKKTPTRPARKVTASKKAVLPKGSRASDEPIHRERTGGSNPRSRGSAASPVSPANRPHDGVERTSPSIPRTETGQFPKGVSGNPSGRPKNTPILDGYRKYLATVKPGDPEQRTYGELIALAAINRALKGNVDAVKEVTDRVEGRSRQRLEHTGANGGPIDFSNLTPEERDRELATLAAELGYTKGDE